MVITGTAAGSEASVELTRAEVRAQMAAMRRSITEMYVPNAKRGGCEPTIDMPDEVRLSALSNTM